MRTIAACLPLLLPVSMLACCGSNAPNPLSARRFAAPREAPLRPGAAAAVDRGPRAPSAHVPAVRFNGRELGRRERRALARLGVRLPAGDYWYDRVSGATGRWGGPTAGFLPAGLRLGGRMSADCSGGGTLVYVNGRELHPIDLASLQRVVGRVLPGCYFCDARGNAGRVGGPVLCNLRQAAAGARGGRRGGVATSDVGDTRTHVGVLPDGGVMVFDSKGGSYSSR